MSARKSGKAGQPVTIASAASLTSAETAEALALKQVCDAADGLDLKLVWSGQGEGPQVFLARAGAELVGYCSLDGDGAVAELCGMVAPAWRRRGIALRLFEAARVAFRDGGGEQLYAICEDASVAGRAFMEALSAQRSFSEHRMELGAKDLPPDDGALEVRQLHSGDQASISDFARVTADGFERSMEQTLRHIPTNLDDPNERLYLALAHGAPIGAFKLYREGATVGIYGFTVERSRQRQGLGRRMLARACALAHEQGAERVTLEVETTNERAIALYTSSGFETTTTYGYYALSRSLLAAGLHGAISEMVEE
ncbi:MAG TPA: GNAT family N-acetyltransferase [Ktedonobacterales bacterium]